MDERAIAPTGSLIRESLQHLRAGALSDLGATWRHEGLKKGVEHAMHWASKVDIGRWALEQVVAYPTVTDGRLETGVAGLCLESPVGLAPGWDKPGKTIHAWQLFQAKHTTIGGIPFHRQPGGPMPRLLTFDDYAGDHGTSKSINCYGFPSVGVKGVACNIGRQREIDDVFIPVIGQVTVNKEFYAPEKLELIPGIVADTIQELLPVVDAINLGLSSPNTLGMRDAQAYEFLYRIIVTALDTIASSTNRKVPLILKGDADGGKDRLDMYCRLAVETGIVLELINTTNLKKIKAKYKAEHIRGGLAGADPDYQQMAIDAIAYVYEETGAEIIGMGGVDSGTQALKLLKVGASAIGINSAVRQYGPAVMNKVEWELSELLDREVPRVVKLADIIGIDTKRGPKSLAA